VGIEALWSNGVLRHSALDLWLRLTSVLAFWGVAAA